jgi:hypothetical protein
MWACLQLKAAGHSGQALAIAPLAGGARDASPDPVFFLSGMAVLSAGLVVMRAARDSKRTAATFVVPAHRLAPRQVYTAERALAEREWRAGDREVLIHALATAAETFYSIAGHLPREASDRALGKADDLRELVWLNRGR